MRFFALALFLGLVIPVAPAQAQQKVHRVGVLNFGFAAPNIIASPINLRITERLAELGFKDGHNLVLERRWADAKLDRVGPLTAELAEAKVDVIITIGNGIAKIVTEANPR